MKTIAAATLGCKVNQYDTEAILEAFERAGYASVPFSADADVYLVNTCTVTGTGDQKSLKTIRRAARLHPDSAILVCGCLAQREAESIARMDNVRLVLGVQRRAEAVELLERALAESTTINAVAPLKGAGFEKLFVSRHEGRTRATMKIQEGCDRYCAYCIIPTVRGPVRSMPLNDVKAEAKRLADSGYREIVLTGIHLASYGRGTDDALIDAIRAVHDTPGVARVRLGSLEPKIADEAFARALSELPGLARQFHLSLQSGSAGVLKRMNRRYTPEEYLAACETLRRWMPGCAVTTDVIVGFPGETEAEFEETVSLIQQVHYDSLFTFIFSPRAGTPAASMDDPTPKAEKNRRFDKLCAVQNAISEEIHRSYIGKTLRCLVDGRDGENLTARTEGGRLVRFAGADSLIGSFCPIEITGATTWSLTGRLAE